MFLPCGKACYCKWKASHWGTGWRWNAEFGWIPTIDMDSSVLPWITSRKFKPLTLLMSHDTCEMHAISYGSRCDVAVAQCCTMLHHVAPPNLALDQMLRPQLGAECKERKNREKERDFSLWKFSKAKRWLAMTRNCKMCVDRSRCPKYDCMFPRPSGFPWISLYTRMPVVGKCQHRLKLDSLRGSCRFCHVFYWDGLSLVGMPLWLLWINGARSLWKTPWDLS
jgi:hypothetical protein